MIFSKGAKAPFFIAKKKRPDWSAFVLTIE
jgi:hypothetical protein